MNTSDFCTRLNSVVPTADGAHLQALEELTAGANELAGCPETAAAIFAFLERHSTADLGSPGPLIHYLERAFPVYVDALVSSVLRRPVGYTLWMTNRILNAKIPQTMRDQLLLSLRQASEHPLASELERRQAREFIERQANAG